MANSDVSRWVICVGGLLGFLVCISWFSEYLPIVFSDARGVKIVMIGDSNTHSQRNYTADGLGRGYVRLVNEKLKIKGRAEGLNFVILNKGDRGDGLRDIANRWRTDVIGEKPDVLCLAIGINDATGKRLNNVEFESTYRELLQLASKANPRLRIMLMEIFLVGGGPGWLTEPDLLNLKKDVVAKNKIIRAIGKELGATVVLLEKLLRENPDHNSDFRPEKDDGIHISKRGHQRIADAWLVAFEG
jgi:lysophospholipase L1-like esterase